MKPNYKITGADAIRIAERDQVQIYCYANPIDDGGKVTAGVALQIFKDDPSLVFIEVVCDGWRDAEGRALDDMPGYNVSDYFTTDGMYLGPDDDKIEPRWTDAPETP